MAGLIDCLSSVTATGDSITGESATGESTTGDSGDVVVSADLASHRVSERRFERNAERQSQRTIDGGRGNNTFSCFETSLDLPFVKNKSKDSHGGFLVIIMLVIKDLDLF